MGRRGVLKNGRLDITLAYSEIEIAPLARELGIIEPAEILFLRCLAANMDKAHDRGTQLSVDLTKAAQNPIALRVVTALVNAGKLTTTIEMGDRKPL